MKKKIHWQLYVITLLILVSVVLGSWIADGIKGEVLFEMYHEGFQYPVIRWGVILVCIILFILCLQGIYYFRKTFAQIRTVRETQSQPHKAVILPLTKYEVNQFQLVVEDNQIELKYLEKPEITPTNFEFPILDSKKLENTINTIQEKWSWQQILRGILPHFNIVEKIVILPTVGTEHLFPLAFNFLNKLFPNIQIIQGKTVDLNKFQSVIDSFESAIKDLLEISKIHERDIVIDITGGQKPISIAGAMVTLRRNVTFQYVETNKPYLVKMYDMTVEISPDFN